MSNGFSPLLFYPVFIVQARVSLQRVLHICVKHPLARFPTDEGCQWFATDPENEKLLIEIQDRVSSHKLAQKNSLEAGHVVQAHKYEVLTRRAEGIQEEVLRRSSQELRERLKARKQELEREQSHATTNES